MKESKTGNKEVKADLESFREAFKISADYCKPQWDNYLRFYKLFRGIKPPEMDATISNIWINIFNSIVANRRAQIFDMVFSHPEYVTLKSDSPEYDLMRDSAQAWLRELLDEKIKIRSDALATVDSALIGGTGYRMPYVRYENRNGRQTPIISSKDVHFFNCLPSPNGGLINPTDYHREDAVDWMLVVDWWTEEKIEKCKNMPGYNKEQINKMLGKEATGGSDRYEEDSYKDSFKTINGLSYEGYSSQASKVTNLPAVAKKRRLVHWYLRDRHLIVAEDAYVIYSGEPPIGEGVIPLVKYSVSPDLKNFFGISQIEMVEDLVMAMIMNFNYRMDHMLGVMFPTTWIRDDIKRGKSMDDFIPRPYAVNFFPDSVSDIRNAIHYDRRPEVTQQTFVDEDRMKAWLQAVSGEMETTGSYADVVGNRSATGVSTIANQLKARPNMEAAILEETGLREECTLLLKLGDLHVNSVQDIGRYGDGFVSVPGSASSSAWREVSPLDVTDKFTVRMHGTKHLSDENQRFQKLISLYPYWNNNPGVDQYELNKQISETANVLPEPDKVFVPPAPPPGVSPARPQAAMPGAPGGAASALDINQVSRSTNERTRTQPAGNQRMTF
jgi:hypothetical protein